jgi:hypothetical protein
MSELHEAAAKLEAFVVRMVPRVLSHICRDPGSAAYGACDRDWWHYKIRDFPSIVLQQAGYTLYLAGEFEAFASLAAGLRQLAGAAARFWSQRATRRGAFEEYYPWEEGYPPLAFSTLAIAKLVRKGVVPSEEVESGARHAARQLLDRFESEAANQQIAGLAALAVLAQGYPALVPEAAFRRLSERSLGLQSEEGWFVEYGGPDLGYLSVTLDCLWDLYDATSDATYLNSAKKALDYLAALVPVGAESIGMHNSRNTDYVLPYGIVRFLASGAREAAVAASLFARLYGGLGNPSHFLHAIDDRYVCHYTGHSLGRACIVLRRLLLSASTKALFAEASEESERLFPVSGQFVRSTADGTRLLVSLKKGGVWSLQSGRARVADFGWVATIGPRQFVSHWWSDTWHWERVPEGFRVEGTLAPHRERLSSPVAHAVLRLASFFLGRRIIGWVKRRLIFHSVTSPYRFERRLLLTPEGVEVQDQVHGLPREAEVRAAPRSSKRHVASADAFHCEDLLRVEGVDCERSSRRTGDGFEAQAVYRLPS